ncbi:hypothetical protein Acr_17g0011840 [Actinidia rufa]|uniref:Uncharacterized protein n=1 Tax=Actinidia rufa TaxID=165716 RepID=A0A7J0G4F1_9ERIC|nr:hypothetical protein Acr_17g0011840 [Actinidia rufa]
MCSSELLYEEIDSMFRLYDKLQNRRVDVVRRDAQREVGEKETSYHLELKHCQGSLCNFITIVQRFTPSSMSMPAIFTSFRASLDKEAPSGLKIASVVTPYSGGEQPFIDREWRAVREDHDAIIGQLSMEAASEDLGEKGEACHMEGAP